MAKCNLHDRSITVREALNKKKLENFQTRRMHYMGKNVCNICSILGGSDGNYNDVDRNCVDENAIVILNSTSENYECQCTQGYEMDTKSRICKKIEGRLLVLSS